LLLVKPVFINTWKKVIFTTIVKPAVLSYVTFQLLVKPAVLSYVTFQLLVKPAVLSYVTFQLQVKPAVLSYVTFQLLQSNQQSCLMWPFKATAKYDHIRQVVT
jgi:hypothetical protein